MWRNQTTQIVLSNLYFKLSSYIFSDLCGILQHIVMCIVLQCIMMFIESLSPCQCPVLIVTSLILVKIWISEFSRSLISALAQKNPTSVRLYFLPLLSLFSVGARLLSLDTSGRGHLNVTFFIINYRTGRGCCFLRRWHPGVWASFPILDWAQSGR